MKSVRIRRFSSPYSVQMRENTENFHAVDQYHKIINVLGISKLKLYKGLMYIRFFRNSLIGYTEHNMIRYNLGSYEMSTF